MKIKTSELHNIIREELEVILTNEEAGEIFGLDMSALLDEMMNEDELPTDKTDGRWDGEKMDPRRSKHDKPGVKGLARRRGARGRQQAAKEDLEEAQLDEKDLSAAERRALPDSDFALAGKGEGPKGKQAGSYPIPDEKHARSALSLVSQHGTSEEKAKVRAAVKRKFPGIDQGKD